MLESTIRRIKALQRWDGTTIRILGMIELLLAEPLDYSFPSGHSLSSFIAAVITLRYSRRAGVPALILAAVIAFSRLYLYVHFPTDVLAGILLGTAIGLGVWYFCERVLFRRRQQEYL